MHDLVTEAVNYAGGNARIVDVISHLRYRHNEPESELLKWIDSAIEKGKVILSEGVLYIPDAFGGARGVDDWIEQFGPAAFRRQPMVGGGK